MKRLSIRKLILPFLLIVSAQLAAQTGPRQPEWNNENFDSGLETMQQSALDSLVVWQEQVVLHTDKSILLPKDHLFFKAYILTGPEQLRVSASDVLKVELLDENGVLIKSQYHKIEEGTSEGSFEIPKKIKDGKYYLRAYTRWMLNYGPDTFATKRVEVSSKGKASKYNYNDYAVFPESGNLIAGLANSVAVSIGEETPINIPVVNSKGEEVASVKNYGIGIGTFLFKPEKGEQYHIQLNDKDRILLPAVKDTGYTLMANNLANDNLKVRIEVTPSLSSTAVFLKGSAKGITYFKTMVDFKEKTIAELDILKGDFPSGILSLELVDEFDQIWAYRPIFIDKEDLQINVERKNDNPENNLLKIRITDRAGNPVQTNFSIGLQAKKHPDSNYAEDIDLTLDKSARGQRFYNDLMVLTRQTSEDIQSDTTTELPTEIRYNFQDGLEFYGQVYDLNNKLLTNTKIQMLISTDDDLVVQEAETNAEGLFKLSGLQINGEVSIIFRTAGEETKSRLVVVIPYEYEIPPLAGGDRMDEVSNQKAKLVLPKIPWVEFQSSAIDEKLIVLEEVTLIATKTLQKKSPSVYDIEPSRLIYQDKERPKPIPQLFLGVPGVQVSGLGGLYPRLSLPRSAGAGPVLWVVDGLPLMQPNSLVDVISLISYPDIERIEILLGPEAAIYGARGSGGVIAIYTRSGSDVDYIDRKEAQLSFAGFHESINFKEYQETILNKANKMGDIPTTLYWNPELRTNENGEAIIQLSSQQNYDVIEIHANAITEKGARGSLKTVY